MATLKKDHRPKMKIQWRLNIQCWFAILQMTEFPLNLNQAFSVIFLTTILSVDSRRSLGGSVVFYTGGAPDADLGLPVIGKSVCINMIGRYYQHHQHLSGNFHSHHLSPGNIHHLYGVQYHHRGPCSNSGKTERGRQHWSSTNTVFS